MGIGSGTSACRSRYYQKVFIDTGYIKTMGFYKYVNQQKNQMRIDVYDFGICVYVMNSSVPARVSFIIVVDESFILPGDTHDRYKLIYQNKFVDDEYIGMMIHNMNNYFL